MRNRCPLTHLLNLYDEDCIYAAPKVIVEMYTRPGCDIIFTIHGVEHLVYEYPLLLSGNDSPVSRAAFLLNRHTRFNPIMIGNFLAEYRCLD